MKEKFEIEVDVPDGKKLIRFDTKAVNISVGDGTCNREIILLPVFEDIPKPKEKVIDLSCVVGIGIDCEFSDYDDFEYTLTTISKLVKIAPICPPALGVRRNFPFTTERGSNFRFCRIRQSPHVYFWEGEYKCPLPEGLNVRLYFIGDDGMLESDVIDDYRDYDWRKVVGFEILGLADGWRYKWDKK